MWMSTVIIDSIWPRRFQYLRYGEYGSNYTDARGGSAEPRSTNCFLATAAGNIRIMSIASLDLKMHYGNPDAVISGGRCEACGQRGIPSPEHRLEYAYYAF